MRISTSHIFARGLSFMLDNQAKISDTEAQLATGKRILSPSDDTAASVRILDLQKAESQLEQYQRNADMAYGRLSQEETALEGIENLLQRVRELTIQGNNGTNDIENKQAIAEEIREHMKSFIQLANYQDSNGEYIFGGYKTGTQPITHDGSGGFTYNGDSGQRELQIGSNRSVADGDPGRLFMDIPANAGGVTNIGAVLYTLQANFEAGNADPDALSDIDEAMGRILNTRAAIGARMNAIDEQKSANDAFNLAVAEVRSSLEDLDYAEAISRFEQQLAALQASQQSFLKIQDLSLFNFIR